VAAFAAERASAGQLTLLWASLDRQYRALERDQKLAAEDQAFHHLIAEIAGNTVILNVLETLAHLMRHLREQGLSEREPELTIREHVNILNAIARREPELARASMVLHLNTVVHSAAGVHQSRAE
jgi:DNA-binding FadR family transcriptional regulator